MDSIKKKMQSLATDTKQADERVAAYEEEIRLTNERAEAAEEQTRY